MENASKALIIAGAILLAILIIGLAMVIYNRAQGTLNDSTGKIDATKVAAFNSEFEKYAGSQTGANTRALYQSLQNHNRANADDSTLQISCNVNTTATKQSAAKVAADSIEAQMTEAHTTDVTLSHLGDIKAGNKYYVSFQYAKSGFIVNCQIQLLQAD